jgi:hypothetical protein
MTLRSPHTPVILAGVHALFYGTAARVVAA